jgi:hypothetical protein
MNEEKEFKKLKVGINLAIRRAMDKRLSPELIKEALEDCALCQLFNETNFKNNFSNVSNEANPLEKKNEKKTLKIKRFLARNGENIATLAIVLLFMDMVPMSMGSIIGAYVFLVVLFLLCTGTCGAYLRKRMVMQ